MRPWRTYAKIQSRIAAWVMIVVAGFLALAQAFCSSGKSSAGRDGGTCTSTLAAAHCTQGWCEIPAGCFTMGSPSTEWGRGKNNEEQHDVQITHPFAMMDHELTLTEWSAMEPPVDLAWVRNRDAGPYACEQDGCPIVGVSWFDALLYANHLSRSRGLPECYVLANCTTGPRSSCTSAAPSGALVECDGYRLATEAEWEYAARGGTTTAFWSGDITPLAVAVDCTVSDPALEDIAWYCKNSQNSTHQVRTKRANPFGLYDMLGNVFEFVNDEDGYYDGPAVDPLRWPPVNSAVVMRGGLASGWSQLERAAGRASTTPGSAGAQLGFRLVRTLKAGTQISDLVDMTVAPSPLSDAGAD